VNNTEGGAPVACKKALLGDIQMESILTPLMFPRKPGEPPFGDLSTTQPDLCLLDVGCGWGRLLGSLLAFPKYFTQHVSYIGCEPTDAQARLSKEEMNRLQFEISKSAAFDEGLAEWDVLSWESLKARARSFDFVYLVNVLHHIPPNDLPRVFGEISTLMKDGAIW
jgi:cyclopropane fatty-acyl-phospholipid synthase-like methyltransferase